jgi:hypothetical protein
MKENLKKNKRRSPLLQYSLLLMTVALSINLLFPIARGSSLMSSITQQISPGILTVICTHQGFDFEPLHINSAASPSFYSFWKNPKRQTNYSTDPINCGDGVTVQDKRYNGGFKLQVAATPYRELTDIQKTIDTVNLAVVTEQLDSSYNESLSTSSFNTTNNQIAPGFINGDNTEVAFPLPFDFTYYGITYETGTNIYLCSNGSINFTQQNCSAPATPLNSVFHDTAPRILPYYKDLNMTQPETGIYTHQESPATLKITWIAQTKDTSPETVQFQVKLHNDITLPNNNNGDVISFHYPAQITDTGTKPIIGLTNGGEVQEEKLESSVYTESTLSRSINQEEIAGQSSTFTPSGFDFLEVKSENTQSTIALYNGNPYTESDYTYFTAPTVDLLDGSAPENGGRVGIYTIYPSYRLTIPNNTPAGIYRNEITYTLSDATY